MNIKEFNLNCIQIPVIVWVLRQLQPPPTLKVKKCLVTYAFYVWISVCVGGAGLSCTGQVVNQVCWLQTTGPSQLWIWNLTRTFFLWGISIHVAYVCGSTRVPICSWNNAMKGTWGLHPPVKLKSHHMTYIVLVWRKTQP
jgi:hypothetical protein